MNLTQRIRRHPIVAFFFLAYAGCWVIWIPVLLSLEGLGIMSFHIPVPAPLFLMVSTITGPTLAAFVVQGVTEGRPGLRMLRNRILRFRVNLLWYLLVIFGPPALLLAGATLWLGTAPLSALAQHWSLLLTAFLPAAVLGLVITVFEEIGWMGVAMPRLQTAFAPLVGCAILGPLWATWHLPSFFVSSSGGAQATGVNLPLIGLQLVVLSLYAISFRVPATWVFNRAGAAVPLIMLGHSAWDQAAGFVSQLKVPHLGGDALDIVSYASWAVLAVLVALLTRGRLGNRRVRNEESAADGTVVRAAAT